MGLNTNIINTLHEIEFLLQMISTLSCLHIELFAVYM